MNILDKQISVFEHDAIHTDRGKKRISAMQLKLLQEFHGIKGIPYYSLIHNGIKFKEFVGVLRVGNTTIEVLPKTDKSNDVNRWRKVLIGMLHSAGLFDIDAPSVSNLNIKPNSILDLYFELFIHELEYILYRGLVKKYRKTSGNLHEFKGSLHFGKHISLNTVHKERFFVTYTTYDNQHLIHFVLLKALKVLNSINTDAKLRSRINFILLNFPELPDIKTSQSTFDNLTFDRKTTQYKNAVEIARLILLNYHPDISQGSNNVLSLMFDMNFLWEQFILSSIGKYKSNGITIHSQNVKNFWATENGNKSKMKPDIILNKGTADCIVLDTKWKNINKTTPSSDDLRQMYVYSKFFNARKVALVYPGDFTSIKGGNYYNEITDEVCDNNCSLITIAVQEDIRQWQKSISNQVIMWFTLE